MARFLIKKAGGVHWLEIMVERRRGEGKGVGEEVRL